MLGISLRTVQNQIAHIFDKLGVHSRSGVAVWLVENDFAWTAVHWSRRRVLSLC